MLDALLKLMDSKFIFLACEDMPEREGLSWPYVYYFVIVDLNKPALHPNAAEVVTYRDLSTEH